jgi:hypothetical protein
MRQLFVLCSCITLLSLAACGGGGSESQTPPPSSDNPPPAPPPPPVVTTIEGVATPSSVAVVTATNAQ